MSQFYVSIIFLGIMLVIVAIVMIAYDKKNSLDYTNRLDSKKQELTGIIADAEQMIEEMNKFSDYIVTQMDLKNEQLFISLKEFEEKVENLRNQANNKIKVGTFLNEKVVNGGNTVAYNSFGIQVASNNYFDSTYDGINIDVAGSCIPQVFKQNQKPKMKELQVEKVIPMNGKYREVIQLSQNGLDNTEIAKRLNMGKGEVHLIIDTCRQI